MGSVRHNLVRRGADRCVGTDWSRRDTFRQGLVRRGSPWSDTLGGVCAQGTARAPDGIGEARRVRARPAKARPGWDRQGMARRPYKVCSSPGCPNLLAPGEFCPQHGRDPRARWSTDRDGAEQHRFRARVLKRDGHTCTHCGHYDPTGRSLDAHHTTPTEGVTLCNSKANGCHRKMDSHAR